MKYCWNDSHPYLTGWWEAQPSPSIHFLYLQRTASRAIVNPANSTGGGGVRGPGPVNGVETPAWTSCGQVCYQGGAMPVRCTQIPLSSDESEPVASSLFTNTSLIIEFNILNGSFPRDYCTLPQAQSFMSFNLSERFNNNSSNIRCLSLLSTEFRDANTQAPLEQMEMSICTRMLSASCGHSRCICSCGQNKNALLFKWNHSGVTGTSIPSKNALAKTN